MKRVSESSLFRPVTFILSVFLLALFIGFSSMVACAATFTVTTTNDSGVGSLRQAIIDANAIPGVDVIELNVTGTITLSSSLVINSGMSIQGPGAGKLAVSGNDATRIFVIETSESVDISDISVVSGDSGTGWGGGMIILVSDNVEIESCIFSMNTAPSGYGGAIYNNLSSPTFVECTFSNNNAKTGGGAIYSLESGLTLNDCTFKENSAESYGGAIYNNFQSTTEPTRITGCTFSGNRATLNGDGGAIYNSYGDNVKIINSTFLGNDAFHGGAISNQSSSPNITNCTFAYNTAISGSGIYNQSSSPVATNCIFWDKVSDEIYNASGTPELNYCVVKENGVGDGTVFSNIITADPMLGDLKDNGGPTKTCALGDSSSAIDEGTDAGDVPDTDQRGVERPQGGGYEIGAYELVPSSKDGGGGGGCNVSVLPLMGLLMMIPLVLLFKMRK